MINNQSNFIDLFSLMLHASVAEKMRLNPQEVLQIARQNLNRWLKNKNSALCEWQQILDTQTPQEIIKIITQDTDDGQRLRSSSPFVGVLSE
jgi:tRNA A37 threonylcarbamoyladenosine biosynthesis protein TsaE